MEKLGCRKSTLDHRYAQHPFLGSATGYKAKNCFRKKLPTLGTVMKFRDFFVFFFFFLVGSHQELINDDLNSEFLKLTHIQNGG